MNAIAAIFPVAAASLLVACASAGTPGTNRPLDGTEWRLVELTGNPVAPGAASDDAPFLRFDYDPYLVILGGKLVWIQDAYTTASTYPYSEPTTYAESRMLGAGDADASTDRLGGSITFGTRSRSPSTPTMAK